jgi:hypothetical protein
MRQKSQDSSASFGMTKTERLRKVALPQDSSTSFGMTRTERLRKVALPQDSSTSFGMTRTERLEYFSTLSFRPNEVRGEIFAEGNGRVVVKSV